MKIATLKSDFIGSSIFFAIIVSFGSYILWYISPLIIIPFILILIILYLFVLYSYFDIYFYEDYFIVKRVIGKTKINMKYESIKEAKYVYSQGRGNVLFNIKFQKNDINLNNASFSQAGFNQFRRIAKILKDNGVVFKVMPKEKENHFWGWQ